MFFEDTKPGYTKYQLLSLPNSKLKGRKNQEYSSSCPVCGGEDRFQFWPEVGNYWCRQCGLRGFVTDAPILKNTTLASIMNSKITTSTLEAINWESYHYSLMQNDSALRYWETALGHRFMLAVEKFRLGYCADYLGLGATVTIPISYSGKVYVIKHRILAPRNGKYITEPRETSAMILNLDEALTSKKVIICEGEKKAIRVWLEGYTAISASCGALGWQEEWDIFLHGKEVYVIYDPDPAGNLAGTKLAQRLNGTLVEVPNKIDDYINNGGNLEEILGEPAWNLR